MTILPNWRAQLDQRQQKEIAFAELYARDYNHGTTGHNALLLINRLTELLDIAAGLKEVPPPPNPDDLVLSFGKYIGKTLPEVLRIDRGYLEWLAREGRDQDLRLAAAAVLRGPVMPMPLDAAPAADEEVPF